jgi:hypothetical protein
VTCSLVESILDMVLHSWLSVRVAHNPAFLFSTRQVSVRMLNTANELSFNFLRCLNFYLPKFYSSQGVFVVDCTRMLVFEEVLQFGSLVRCEAGSSLLANV